MKTSKLIGIVVATSVVLLGSTAIFAQQPNGQHNSTGNQVHQTYLDENGDGINDNMPARPAGGRCGQHQGMYNNSGSMHGQNVSGTGHQNGGHGMQGGSQSMYSQGMMDGQNNSGMGHQDGMCYYGGMNSSSGMGGGHGSNGMGRH